MILISLLYQMHLACQKIMFPVIFRLGNIHFRIPHQKLQKKDLVSKREIGFQKERLGFKKKDWVSKRKIGFQKERLGLHLWATVICIYLD